MKWFALAFVALVGALAFASPAAAQYQITESVIGSGGTNASGGSYQMLGTVGQPVIGVTEGGSYRNEIGFWYMPGWVLTGVDDEELPLRTHFGQSFPNPFNPVTTIAYGLATTAHVTIRVYDVSGREVRTLVDADMEPGRYSETLDAAGLAGGVYFARMTADTYTETMKLVLIK
ncbi:MAG: T9SS type A sorting domain-containing protein [Candidatus Eisenbacteria bacterium]